MEKSKPGSGPLDAVGQSPRDATSFELRAERLVAEYLRVWGLRDPQTIATLSRHWVRSVHASGSVPAGGSLTELYRTVIRRARGDIEQRLDRLAGALTTNSREARGCRGLLAIELQSVVDQFPTALLEESSLPAPLHEQLASAALSVVPACCPTQMPTQSLEAISSEKYFSRWNQMWSYLWFRLRRTFA